MKKILSCVSPIDGSVFAAREAVPFKTAKKEILVLRQAQAEWADNPLDERIALVKDGVQILGAMNNEIVTELAQMMGRPVRFGGEFSGVNERASYMASIAKASLADVHVNENNEYKRYIKRLPHGVVFVIAPWNYPYLTAINTIVPALISGNAVVLKHSTQTLLAGERICEAFHQAGVPKNVFKNMFLDHETSIGLIRERMFDFINFTGSVNAGRTIELAAGGSFVGVSTELGGKDPAYVMEDANIDAAVDGLMDGAMFNSGQCCCGIERIYVHESVYNEFLEKSIVRVNSHRLGNPLDPDITLGPMASPRLAKLVRKQISNAIEKGATPHIERFAKDDGEAYLSPQILTNVNHEMDIMREENFGPVVGVMPVNDDIEAIRMMNDSHYGLTASLWTGNLKRAEQIGKRVETGTVFMNRADYLDPALCWTGCKDTGRSGALSTIGYQNLTRPKSFHLKKLMS